jgi:hypothetical protein
MKITDAEFKQLQTEWYRKLADSGFRDVERSGRVGPSPTTSEEILIRETYYSRLNEAIYDEQTEFRNEIDKHILTRHAEGAAINTIVNELREFGTPRQRKAIRFIIRKYVMNWGIRSFTRKQLNLKDKS